MTNRWSLADRQLEPEDMDDPALPAERLHGALTGLTRLNFVSNSARIVWPPITYLASCAKAPLKVLDIATGAGDVPIALWRRAQRARISLEIHGIDFNPKSVEFARQKAAELNAPITFERRDALTDDLPAGFDVVMCSLFLHHLTNEDAVKLLGRMADAARCLGMVSDLRRNIYGLFLASGASRLLSRSSVVHKDAVCSVRAAFTMPELSELAEKAGVPPGKISRQWPARMLLAWYTPGWSQRR
jgi:2-polyprenyl-3-methyl-5-hydroxy-6-metoxy-1,4-benzoquinol methylase